jgi:type I restriction enzyme M protein
MSNVKDLISKTENYFNYSVNRVIISGRILADLNDSPKVYSTKESFIQASLAYTDPKHEQIVKELQASVQTTLADIKSNELFEVTNDYRQVSTKDLIKVLNAISENHYFSGRNFENGLDELMIKLAEVESHDSILDPTSGFKGAWLKLLKENPEQKITIQEIEKDFIALAYLNAKVTGANNFEIYQGDVLADPKYVSDGKLELFDKVITFPPISMRINKEAMSKNKFNRFRFGKVGMRADFAFISNAIASLNEKGKAVIAVADGPLFQSGSTGKIRQNLVNDDLIEAVISLPDHMFITAGVPINLLVINKDKHNFKGRIQFINGNQTDWYKHGRFVNALTSTGIEEITKIYTEKIKKDGISTIINNDDYKDTLSVKKYILPTDITIDDQKYHINKEGLQKKNRVSLDQLVEIKRGFSVTQRNETATGKYLAIKVIDINDGKINKNKLSHINIPTNPSRYSLKKSDLLLSTRGTLGKVAMIDEDNTNMVASANLVALRAKSDDINMKWLMYYLLSPMGKFEISQAASGTAVSTISPSDLRNIQIPVISKAKQDQAVEQFEQTKEKLDQRLKELQKQYLKNEDKLYDSWQMNQILTK